MKENLARSYLCPDAPTLEEVKFTKCNFLLCVHHQFLPPSKMFWLFQI